MSLVIDERTGAGEGELILGVGSTAAVWYRVTVERLRGVAGATWYGYFIPTADLAGVLPGRYELRLGGSSCAILVRRVVHTESGPCFPFWGLDHPPENLPELPLTAERAGDDDGMLPADDPLPGTEPSHRVEGSLGTAVQ